MKEITVGQKTRQRLNDQSQSNLEKYQEMAVGRKGVLALLSHEAAILLFSQIPGGLGFFLRRRFYRPLFGRLGRAVLLGKGIALRCPNRIFLGDRTAIDDECLLSAGSSDEEAVFIEDDVIIARSSVLQTKHGSVKIGKKTNISPHLVLSAVNEIRIGKSVMIGGHCYIGGGFYHAERTDIPMMEQGVYSRGPLIIEDDVWLGAGVIVLDGVHIGRGCIVGAGAVVTEDLPDYSIAVGVPARVIRSRLRESANEVNRN
jgi:acetyltransferase-like isoleucine patch superfamily enzyme